MYVCIHALEDIGNGAPIRVPLENVLYYCFFFVLIAQFLYIHA